MAKVMFLTHSKRNITANPLNSTSLIRNRNSHVPASKAKSASKADNIKKSTISTLKKTPRMSMDLIIYRPCKSKKLINKSGDSGIEENESSLSTPNRFCNHVTDSPVELVTYESSDDSHSNIDV
ncbi:unnamed protein product [Schistosoma curassoni]|uniref:Ovule protein n=2 Tax=Schistosoma TaxID=6181 RepID=A0A183JNB7_9TREM|nr:unnamed protein product [Schistosoma curassoni]